MKANELMIGDYCRCGSILVKITRISETSASGLDLDALDPIPLTAEILEKNFYHTKTDAYDWNLGYHCQEYDYNGLFYIILNEDNNTIHIDGCEWGSGVSYVHELQNTLRIHGLNHLADNFKV